MSSAYLRKPNKLPEAGKSLMYIENKGGHKIDPCGTPYFVQIRSENQNMKRTFKNTK